MRNKKLEKTHSKKKKKSHAQDNIYTVHQFTYVHKVTGISLLSKKKIQSATVQFFYSKKRQQQTLITKTAFSTSCAQDSQWATKRAKFFFLGALPLNP